MNFNLKLIFLLFLALTLSSCGDQKPVSSKAQKIKKTDKYSVLSGADTHLVIGDNQLSLSGRGRVLMKDPLSFKKRKSGLYEKKASYLFEVEFILREGGHLTLHFSGHDQLRDSFRIIFKSVSREMARQKGSPSTSATLDEHMVSPDDMLLESDRLDQELNQEDSSGILESQPLEYSDERVLEISVLDQKGRELEKVISYEDLTESLLRYTIRIDLEKTGDTVFRKVISEKEEPGFKGGKRKRQDSHQQRIGKFITKGVQMVDIHFDIWDGTNILKEWNENMHPIISSKDFGFQAGRVMDLESPFIGQDQAYSAYWGMSLKEATVTKVETHDIFVSDEDVRELLREKVLKRGFFTDSVGSKDVKDNIDLYRAREELRNSPQREDRDEEEVGALQEQEPFSLKNWALLKAKGVKDTFNEVVGSRCHPNESESFGGKSIQWTIFLLCIDNEAYRKKYCEDESNIFHSRYCKEGFDEQEEKKGPYWEHENEDSEESKELENE